MQFSTIFLTLSLAVAAIASPFPSPYEGPSSDIDTEVAGHGEGNPNTANKEAAGSSFSNKGKIDKVVADQAVDQCGNSQINCCNEISQEGDQQDGMGLLGSVLSPDGGLLTLQCNPIIGDILASQCGPKNINCCTEEPHTMNSATGSLVALDLKCVNVL